MEREDPLPRRLDQLLPELDGLGQDDLLLRGEERDLADLLEVHPDRVVDPDHVGGDRLELLGRRLLDRLWIELGRGVARQLGRCGFDPVLRDDDDPDVGTVAAGGLRTEVELLVFVLVLIVILGDGDAGRARRPQAGQLGLFEIGLGPSRPRQDGLDELLV